jgi:hypothetical protein
MMKMMGGTGKPKTKKLVVVDVAAIGKKGGKSRAAKMTRQERSESARKAAVARWGKKPADDGDAKAP